MKITLAVLLLAVGASANDHKGDADPMRTACGADAERFCPGNPNPGMCLHEHWDDVSEGCKSFKEGLKKQRQEKQGAAGKEGMKKGEPVKKGGKHHSFENGMKPGAAPKGKIRFEWTQGEPTASADGFGD